MGVEYQNYEYNEGQNSRSAPNVYTAYNIFLALVTREIFRLLCRSGILGSPAETGAPGLRIQPTGHLRSQTTVFGRANRVLN